MRYDYRYLAAFTRLNRIVVEVAGTDWTDQKVFAFDVERKIVWFYGPTPRARPDGQGLIVGSSHGFPVRVFDKETGAEFVPPPTLMYRFEQLRQWWWATRINGWIRRRFFRQARLRTTPATGKE